MGKKKKNKHKEKGPAASASPVLAPALATAAPTSTSPPAASATPAAPAPASVPVPVAVDAPHPVASTPAPAPVAAAHTAEPEPPPRPEGPAGPATLAGCLLRMSWLIVGPALLFVFAAVILVNHESVGSLSDLLYLLTAGGVLGARGVELRNPTADVAHIPGGDAKTFLPRFLGAAGGGLVLAHVVAMLGGK